MATMPQITPSILLQTIQSDLAAPALAAEGNRAGFEAAMTRNAGSEINGSQGAVASDRAQPVQAGMDEGAGNDGDAILSGLEHLRNVFNAQEANISHLMSGSAVDVNTMLALQMEMTNYSMLIDMTSKLATKSAQALDTLMKGQ